MNVLCIGDVTAAPGMDYLAEALPRAKAETGADFVIVNGENSHDSGVGITRHSAEALLQYADCITTGNHCFRRCGEELFLENPTVLHPANYPFTEDAAGCALIDLGRPGLLRVINLAGTAWMEPLDNPFKRLDDLLAKQAARFTIIDFHAESTAEKKAFALYADGRVSAVFGTHTHVQTADEQVLPRGTGFITDVGMTGPVLSVIGMEPQGAIHRQRTHTPAQFRPAVGACMLNGVLFRLDDESGLCREVQRIHIQEA